VFSVHTLSPLGVIWAYVARGDSAPWVRTHFDTQIRMFWTVVGWIVGLAVIGIVLTPLLIGIPILIGLGVVGLILTVWFAVRSILGLMGLAQGRPAA
jgi:uncharacterized membrane protein